MGHASTGTEISIHLRARAPDRDVIDQASELVGAHRSQFMLAAALKEARNIPLDQSTIYANTGRDCAAPCLRTQ